MKEIKIQVRNKIASLENKSDYIVCGNNDYAVNFDFDEEWGAHNVKTALFVFGDETVYSVFEGNLANGVSVEGATLCAIGCFAGDLSTTTPAVIKCEPSIRDLGGVPKAPTPEVYDEIMSLLNRYINASKGAPSGGKKGQVLKKKSDLDYDYSWENDEHVDLTEINEKLNKKVDKSEKANVVYANGSSGEQEVKPFAAEADAGSIMCRDSFGKTKISDASSEDEEYAANVRTAKRISREITLENQSNVNNKVANALKGTAFGSTVCLDDVSPIPHDMQVSVESKNLIPLVYHSRNEVQRGITFTINEDRSITMNGAYDNSGNNISFFLANRPSKPFVLKKGTYIGSTGVSEASFGYKVMNGAYDTFSTAKTFEQDTTLEYLYIGFIASKLTNKVFNGETIYPMLMRGTVVEPYTKPVADFSGVTLMALGDGTEPTTYTANADGTVEGVTSFYPTTTLLTDTEGVTIEVEYNKDANKVVELLSKEIVSLGGKDILDDGNTEKGFVFFYGNLDNPEFDDIGAANLMAQLIPEHYLRTYSYDYGEEGWAIEDDIVLNEDFFRNQCTFIPLSGEENMPSDWGVYVYKYWGRVGIVFNETDYTVNGVDNSIKEYLFEAPEVVHISRVYEW